MHYPNLIIGCAFVLIGSGWIYMSTKSQSAPLSRQALINKIDHPGYGCCYRCEKTWDVVKGHSTYYDGAWGCFPLCEKCWKELSTPEARLPYYLRMKNDWVRMARPQDESLENKWPAIKAAVLAGK